MTLNQVLGDVMTDDTYRDDDKEEKNKEKKDDKKKKSVAFKAHQVKMKAHVHGMMKMTRRWLSL
jgi:hypothetical protein